jgi:hypothetical protein
LLEAVEAAAERSVPDVVAATDAEAAEEGGVFFVRGAGGGAVALFEVGKNAGAAVGERSGAFDPDGAFLESKLNESMELGENGKVVAGFLADEELNDLAEAALVDGTVGVAAGAEVLLGALAGLAVNFHRDKIVSRKGLVMAGSELA